MDGTLGLSPFICSFHYSKFPNGHSAAIHAKIMRIINKNKMVTRKNKGGS